MIYTFKRDDEPPPPPPPPFQHVTLHTRMPARPHPRMFEITINTVLYLYSYQNNSIFRGTVRCPLQNRKSNVMQILFIVVMHLAIQALSLASLQAYR